MGTAGDYDGNLNQGKYWEEIVENHFKKYGYKTKRYTVRDENGVETYQKIQIKGHKDLVYPDLEVEMKTDSILIKQLIEVKSLEFYQDYVGKFYPKLDRKKLYVSIPQYQFDDYVFLQNYLQIETRVIFIITANKPIWLWQTLDYLDETKLPIVGAYYNKQSHYLWDNAWMRKFKDH